MKRADLEAMGIEKENIDKIMKINGTDIEAEKTKTKDLQTKLDDANTKLADANEKLKDVDGKDETIKDLQEKLQAHVDAENQRKEAEKDAELTRKIAEVFPTDKEFTSEYVKKGIIKDIKEALAKDNTKGAREIFDSITKDDKGNTIEGIFKNAQQQQLKTPPAGGNGGVKYTREDVEKMTAEEINKNWADIKASGIL